MRGGLVVGHGGGSQIGDFRTGILVPRDASPGPHRLLLLGSPGEVGATASDQFIVDPGPPPCAGDCNGDGTVTVSEILRGVRRLLGQFDVTCAGFPDVVTVDMLVDAVADALASCGPMRGASLRGRPRVDEPALFPSFARDAIPVS